MGSEWLNFLLLNSSNKVEVGGVTGMYLPPTRRSIHLTSVFRDDVKVVTVPPFADSISEGDIRWEKGKCSSLTPFFMEFPT